MKINIKSLPIEYRDAIYGGLLCVVVCLGTVALWLGYSGVTPKFEKTYSQKAVDIDVQNGIANVLNYGAKPDDDEDDTEAFLKAASTGLSVYVPAGNYFISETVTIDGGFLSGESMTTSITGASDQTLFRLKNGAGIKEITLGYMNNSSGTQPAVVITGSGSGETASYIKDVNFKKVGVAVSDADEAEEKEGLHIGENFENITVEKFSDAAFSLSAERSNTLFRAVKLKSTTGNADYGIRIENDKGTSYEQISYVKSNIKSCISMKNSIGFAVRTLNIEEANAEKIFDLNNASGAIHSVFNSGCSGTLLTLSKMKKTTFNLDFVVYENVNKADYKFVTVDEASEKCSVSVASYSGQNVSDSCKQFSAN